MASAIQTALLEVARLKALEEELAKAKSEAQERLVEALRQADKKSGSVTLESGEVIKGTLVEPQRVSYDEERLKKTLGAKTWGKVTKAVLDKTKLEAEITVGNIDPNVVAGCATVTDTKPYVRISGTYSAPNLLDAVTVNHSTGQPKPAAKRVVRKPKR